MATIILRIGVILVVLIFILWVVYNAIKYPNDGDSEMKAANRYKVAEEIDKEIKNNMRSIQK